MPCSHTRGDVSRIVLGVIRDIQEDQSIVEASVFGPQGINNTPEFRATYFEPIRDGIEGPGCVIDRFSPTDCENAGTVRDIVNAVWNDVRPEPMSAVKAATKSSRSAAPTRKAGKASKTSKARKTGKASKKGKARKPKTKKR